MPIKPRSEPSGDTKEDQLPAFDSKALVNLTKKIEGSLKKPSDGTKPKSTTARPKVKREKKKDDNRQAPAEIPSHRITSSTPKGGAQTLEKHKDAARPTSKQGKKRLRDGRVKESNHQRHGDDVNGTKLGVRGSESFNDGIDGIDEDIRALGGTQDDIDLIANAASDSEIEGEDLSGGDIKKEVLQLIRQLGVDQLVKNELLNDAASDPEYETEQEDQATNTNVKTATKQANGSKLDLPNANATGKGQVSLAFQPQSEWHTVELPTLPTSPRDVTDLPSDLIHRLNEHAKALLEHENKQYAIHNTSASSAHQFYATIMSTGTLSDKISALTLSVQESPLHNMKALESLVNLARKRSRGQAVEVLGALKDLFGPGNLLPSDRKLRTFVGQPALAANIRPTDFHWISGDPLPKPLQERHLILWAYEDWLKAIYFEVLKIIETWCNDEVVFARGKAVDYISQLLKEKPEQEGNLLRLLVNKLGDSDKKIASKASYHMLQVETAHPLMKPTIIAAIESDLLFRSGQSLHAKYYAIITLNQTVLSNKEEAVARKLLDIYFSLFIMLLEKSEKATIPAVEAKKLAINKKGEAQGGGSIGGKKALKKQAGKQKATTADDELREKMLSAVLTGVNRAIPFTSTNDVSFEKHMDTLFKVTHSANFNTSIQALMLIQQLSGSHQGLVDRFYRTLYESLLDLRLLTSSKQALYLNLVFRALRADLNIKRVKAFAKRLLQVVAMHQPPFTCGTLYLLRELEGVFANLSAFIDQPEEGNDEEEHFEDVQEAGVDHSLPNGDDHVADGTQLTEAQMSFKYDGRKRNPEYSSADRSSLWEITPFVQHYHPSVSLFATRLLMHDPMPPKPDLSLNTLIHFLDRFVYRNPKATNALKGASIMQPMAGSDSSSLLISAYSNKDRSRQPVNSEAFWKQDAEKVGADEVFFHRYFSTLGSGKEKAKKKKADKKKHEEESESEGDEDEIWKALVDSRPELDEGSDGGIFSEDDMGSEFEDLEDADEGSHFDKEDNEAGAAGGTDDSLALEGDDDEALLDSDEEVPSDLEADFKVEAQMSGAAKPVSEITDQGEKRSNKKRKLKNLPTFASVDDYASMLDEDEDE